MYVSQDEFKQNILIAALALCYDDQKQTLVYAQLFQKKFTPNRLYSADCINELLAAGRLRFSTDDTLTPSQNVKPLILGELEIIDAASTRLHHFTIKMIGLVRQQLVECEACSEYFQMLKFEIQCCECIEYAIFFANQLGIQILNASPYNASLSFLLHENVRDQVLMLLWRAIKNFPKSQNVAQSDVEFSNLVQTALEYYFWYKENKKEINLYNWPKQLELSKLASVLKLIGR